jgi:nucleoid DNA-binding protein
MNRVVIAFRIAEETGLDPALVRPVVQMTLDAIIEVLATEGRLELRRFGVFDVRARKPRKAHNFKTGVEVMVPEKRRVFFKAGKLMEKRIADGAVPGEQDAVPVPAGSPRRGTAGSDNHAPA